MTAEEFDSDGLALLFLILGVSALLFTFVAYVITGDDNDDDAMERDFFVDLPPSPTMEIDGMVVSLGGGRGSAMRIINERFIEALPHYPPNALPPVLPTNDVCAICLEDLHPLPPIPSESMQDDALDIAPTEGGQTSLLGKKKRKCKSHSGTLRTIIELPCEHFFHENCITPWLYFRSAECPLCKKDVRESARARYSSPSISRGDVDGGENAPEFLPESPEQLSDGSEAGAGLLGSIFGYFFAAPPSINNNSSSTEDTTTATNTTAADSQTLMPEQSAPGAF